MRPATRYPIGSACSAPFSSSFWSSRSHALTASLPAMSSSVSFDSMKSSSPWHSDSIRSFLIFDTQSAVRRWPLRVAIVTRRRAPTRLRPVRRWPSVAAAGRCAARSGIGGGRERLDVGAISASSGSGSLISAACGFSTTSAFRSCRPSAISTVMMLACRIAGSLAQPSTLTTLAANGPPSCAASPRGTTNSAKSTMTATLRGVAAPRRPLGRPPPGSASAAGSDRSAPAPRPARASS